MPPQHLEQQVAAATRGEPDALQRLIVHYHPVLQKKLLAQTGRDSARHIEVEDILQQAYIAAF